MRIGIPAEIRSGETRVAATPETVKKLAAGAKHQLVVQAGAGDGAAIPDAEFKAAGATIVGTPAEAYQSDIVLKVRGPDTAELALVKRGSILAALLNPYDATGLEALAGTGAT
jgi:NAD(P) transhydrogenase subunit alpha